MSPVSKWEPPSRRRSAEFCTSHLRPAPGDRTSRGLKSMDLSQVPSSGSPKSSGQHIGGRIMKLLKLRKKSSSKTSITVLSQESLEPSLHTFRFQDQIGIKGFAAVEDVMERYHYDSDEHSGSYVASGHCDRPGPNSCSTSGRSSASAQSFGSSNVSRPVTPRANSILAGHGQSSAALMANILISISHMDEEDEHSCGLRPPTAEGPHESAWHQPRDEIYAESPRGKHLSSKLNSGRSTLSGRFNPKAGGCIIDQHLTSPGPSRRFGKLDLTKIVGWWSAMINTCRRSDRTRSKW